MTFRQKFGTIHLEKGKGENMEKLELKRNLNRIIEEVEDLWRSL